MKNFIINHSLQLIQQYQPQYDETKIAEIRYGLVSIYLLITKLIVIGAIAFYLHLFRELFLFLIIYNLIRMPSFGLHATKSWICLVSSTLIFIGIPYLCLYLSISVWCKTVIGLFCIGLVWKNAPADTVKRPIVSYKRRKVYKTLSVICAIIFTCSSIIITDQFISNVFITALILQCFMISPFIYKLFHLPYNNYLNYQMESN